MVPVGRRSQQMPHVRREVAGAALGPLAARVAQERAEHARVHVCAQLYLRTGYGLRISSSSMEVGGISASLGFGGVRVVLQ